MKSWRMVGLLLLCLMLVAGISACSAFGSKPAAIPQLAKVVRGDLTIGVSGDGNIDASNEVKLTFGSGGKVDKIYTEEGKTVNKGDVLATLDTSSLELARTQAQVALSQAQVAVTQAQVALAQAQTAQQTAEFNLNNTLGKKDALDLALLNSQIALRTAEYNLEQTRVLYTWSDIQTAQSNVDDAQRYLDYAIAKLGEFVPTDGTDPSNLEGYQTWQKAVVQAQARLDTAKATLNAMLSGTDTEEVAIKKLQVNAAQMAVDQAQKNLDKLDEEKALNESQLDIAKQSVNQVQQSLELSKQSADLAQQSLDESQKQLDQATIIAPFSGTVAVVGVKEGDYISSPAVSARTIIDLIDLNSMELTVKLDEIDIPGVKLNQDAIVSVDALPNAKLKGKVITIYPLSSQSGGVVQYDVKIGLENPEGSELKVGMSASADIITTTVSNVLLVPNRAIKQDSQGKQVVDVMVNGQVQQKAVVVGASDGVQTEIVQGLGEGETVVTESPAKTQSAGGGFLFGG